MAYSSFAELLAATGDGRLDAVVAQREAEESATSADAVRARMLESLEVMRAAVARGLAGDAHSRSGLVGGDARLVAGSAAGPVGGVFSATVAAALATGEVNAAMGRIVAAPTGGASGVLPAVLLSLGTARDASDDDLIDALLVAAGIGGVIAARATLSGAAGGCQAEVGSAAAMAAAAAVRLCGGDAETMGHAASLALQGLLGLVCDPVGGLVEVPCVARNGTGAAVALAAAEMALAGVRFPLPFDDVVDAMGSVGRSLPPSLRETSRGGLAVTRCAQRIVAGLADTAADGSGD